MKTLLTTLCATAALGLAAPTLAQDTMAADASYPWCSASVTDHCRQHEGMSGMKMHHGWAKHHKKMHMRNRMAAKPAMPAHKM